MTRRQTTAALMAAGIAVAVAACSPASQDRASPGTTASSDPFAMVPALAAAQQPRDQLPAGVDVMMPVGDAGAVVPTTSRLLHSGESQHFWVALDEDKRICLVTAIYVADGVPPATAERAASTCAAPDDFFERGLSLQTSGEGPSSRAQLVPADVDTDGLDGAGVGSSPTGESFTSQLVLRIPGGPADGDETTVDRSTGGTFSVRL